MLYVSGAQRLQISRLESRGLDESWWFETIFNELLPAAPATAIIPAGRFPLYSYCSTTSNAMTASNDPSSTASARTHSEATTGIY